MTVTGTVSRDLRPPGRALAIGAHPDDIEFGAGATLAKWSAAGCEVALMVCTDGSKGTWDASADIEALVARRQREQVDAARALGTTGDLVFLDHTDGELESGIDQRREVAAWIRRLRPEVVLGHDPWKRYRLHPDHRHAGRLTVDGVVAARDPHFFPDLGLAHHRPDALLLFEADEPDHVESVSGFEGAKIDALEAHLSQFESTMGISDDDTGHKRDAFRRRIDDELRDHGRLAGVEVGEAFKLIAEL